MAVKYHPEVEPGSMLNPWMRSCRYPYREAEHLLKVTDLVYMLLAFPAHGLHFGAHAGRSLEFREQGLALAIEVIYARESNTCPHE